ncbi:MAG: IclR family transcriptional regulator, partial [Alphaproteobacteria bacterium]|nr:IclR family transcriptional regulator [Alphaproteobacteria bacterium]
ATGRCVAAFGDFDTTTLQSRFALVPWDKQPSFDTWKAQIDNTRRDGYGIDLGEFISGVTIIAAPFFNSSGAVTRSLVALGTSEKMEMTGITSIAHKMLKMRDSVSDYLMSN